MYNSEPVRTYIYTNDIIYLSNNVKQEVRLTPTQNCVTLSQWSLHKTAEFYTEQCTTPIPLSQL